MTSADGLIRRSIQRAAVESADIFPRIAGKWTMTVEWSRDGQQGQRVADARIEEREHGIDMTVSAPDSNSHTLLARWAREPSGAPVLYYLFQVEPKASGSKPAIAYKGAAVLRLREDGTSLSGNYWTDQLSAGHYLLTRTVGTDPAGAAVTLDTQEPVRGGLGMRKLFWIPSLVLLLAILLFLLKPILGGGNDWERRIDVAVSKASEACLLNSSTVVRRNIEAGLSAHLKSLGGKGATAEQTTRRSVNEAFSEAGQLAQDERLRTCVTERTDRFLGYQSGSPTASPGRPSVTEGAPGTAQPPTGVGKSAAAEGYVYYEEDNGALTTDGVFGPLDGSNAPPYASLAKDMVLKSVRAAQLRESDKPNSPRLMELRTGQCVRILEPPTAPQRNLTSATSGGKIKIRAVSCSATP